MIQTKSTIQVFSMNFPPESTGIAPYTGDLVHGLSQANFQVRVVTTYPHYPAWQSSDERRRWISKCTDKSIHIERVLHYIPKKPRGIRRLFSELTLGVRSIFRIFRDSDAVILVSPALFSSATILFLLRLFDRKTPTLLWVQDLYGPGMVETSQGSMLAVKITSSLERWVFQTVTKIVAIDDVFKTYIAKTYFVNPDKIQVIPNWSHVEFPPKIDRKFEREKYGWKPEEIVVLHAGNMGVKQGLANVVEAARIADLSHVKVRFVLCGEGADKEHLKNLGASISKLQFMPLVDDASFGALLQASDFLLVNELPTLEAMSLPSKLTSYLRAGRPILAVTPAESATARIVKKSGAGVLVNPGDPQHLLESVMWLSQDRSLQNECVSAALIYAETNLDRDEAITKLVATVKAL